MKSYLILLLLVLTALPSCFVVDTLLEEDEPQLTLPFEVIVKDSIYHYIQRGKSRDQKYLSYGYEPLKIIVPQTLKDIELWESRRGQSSFNQQMVEQKIAILDSIRRAQNLKRKISQEHIFSLNNRKDAFTDVQRVIFTLSNELNVIDLKPVYQVQLTTNQERLFAKFFYETPIIKAYSYTESQKLSKSFYQYFKDELNRKDNIFDRNNFLMHIIRVLESVSVDNTFNVQTVAQASLMDYMTKKRADIVGYTPKDFSALYEINEDDNLIGYYFFHTFMYEIDDNVEVMSIYVKFNPFYEVKRITETDQDYDVYNDSGE